MRNTGDLRMRVALQRRTVTTLGGKTREDWETIGLYAAEVLHASARDFYGGAGQWYEEKITVHLRTPRTYSPAPGLRVLWQGRTYDVLEVTPDKPLRGITELRAAAAEMEGSGCQA